MRPLTSERKDGTVPVEDELRRILRDVMKRSSKERPVIAQAMTEALGRTITPSMLGDFTRNARVCKKRQVRFPAAWVPALYQATGNDELQRWLAGPHLRALIELGERVCSTASILREIQDNIVKLTGEGLQRKRQPQKA